jgi:hypothetical protein
MHQKIARLKQKLPAGSFCSPEHFASQNVLGRFFEFILES